MADTVATGSGSAAAAAAKPQRKTHAIIQAYLIAYNALSAAGWWYITYFAIMGVKDYVQLYPTMGQIVLWVQTAAVLEIFHSLFGFVRSPVLTTIMQVSSRLTLVWLVAEQFPYVQVVGHWAYTSMVIAWGITES
ncbi:hypothetical protein HDU76_009669, partial [Blyttiomyces sp. JEL0837]